MVFGFRSLGLFGAKSSVIRQDLIPAKTLEDADMAISALSWSSRLLAASGEDKKVRVYDSAEDPGDGFIRSGF